MGEHVNVLLILLSTNKDKGCWISDICKLILWTCWSIFFYITLKSHESNVYHYQIMNQYSFSGFLYHSLIASRPFLGNSDGIDESITTRFFINLNSFSKESPYSLTKTIPGDSLSARKWWYVVSDESGLKDITCPKPTVPKPEITIVEHVDKTRKCSYCNETGHEQSRNGEILCPMINSNIFNIPNSSAMMNYHN
jgi:hypothetical protein